MPNIVNRRKGHKGQSAIEFLLTYGWAILGAMITIGALSYFGIFNTQRYVSDTCYFGEQLICDDYIAYQDGNISVKLRNNFGVDIDINSTIVKSDYGISQETDAKYSKSSTIKPGEVFEITHNITSTTIPMNNKLKYKMVITFSQTGSSNLHNQTGDVTVTVQKP
jgi:hypothetical protein